MEDKLEINSFFIPYQKISPLIHQKRKEKGYRTLSDRIPIHLQTQLSFKKKKGGGKKGSYTRALISSPPPPSGFDPSIPGAFLPEVHHVICHDVLGEG